MSDDWVLPALLVPFTIFGLYYFVNTAVEDGRRIREHYKTTKKSLEFGVQYKKFRPEEAAQQARLEGPQCDCILPKWMHISSHRMAIRSFEKSYGLR